MTWTQVWMFLLLGFFFGFDNGLCRDVTTLSMPFFTSKPNTYRAQVGNSVILICQVENLGDSSIIWKESNRIISAGKIIIRKDDRLSLMDGYDLRIDNLEETDSGKRFYLKNQLNFKFNCIFFFFTRNICLWNWNPWLPSTSDKPTWNFSST